MSDTRIAVITRTKDRPRLLRRALESLYAQTQTNFIHVVVNDGGDEGELKSVLKSFPDPNRIILHNKKPKGLSATLNQAVRSTDAPYISILDDDDTWHPDRLKEVTSHLRSNPSIQACVVKMDIVIEEADEDGSYKEVERRLHPDSGDGEISLFKQCHRNYLSNGIITYSRSIFNQIGGYDESLATAEDWDFGIRLLLETDVDIVRSEQSLFNYHQRPKAHGVDGNSVHDRVIEQEITLNRIRNMYLRKDINEGRLGVGYIMNNVVFDLSNVVRIEGHVNHASKEIIESVSSSRSALESNMPIPVIKRLINRLR